MLWDGHEEVERAKIAFQQAFNDSKPVESAVFRVGDGQAMSDVLLAETRSDRARLALILLLD